MTNLDVETVAQQESVEPTIEQQPSKAALHTLDVLNAGLLPHSTNERDHAWELLQPAYNIQGARLYIEKVAAMHSQEPMIDRPPELTLAAQLGYKNPLVEHEREGIIRAQKQGVMLTITDHMMDYVEDASAMIDALRQLERAISQVDETLPIGKFLVDPKPEIHLAFALLTRMHETLEYATQTKAQKTQMNQPLENDPSAENKDNIQQRIEEATHDLTIGEIRLEVAQALTLEKGRMTFWSDQLIGHPDVTANADKAAVRKREGAVEAHSFLKDRVYDRMSRIASEQFFRTQE
jgi:hypothetical protein